MNQETLLIIDDEVYIRESLSSFFIDEGYRVFTAANGEIGLETFFQEDVDMVITDLRMPRKDGIEVMTTIHAHNPDIPMVVISGAGNTQDVIESLRMGAKDYITKPIIDLAMIRHVIVKALETKHLIQENRQYRKQLEKSEAQYRTITQQIAEGVFTVDAHKNLTFVNPAFCNMLGYSQSRLCRMNLKDLSTQDSFATIAKESLVRRKGLTSRYEIQLINQNGTPVHVELACSPMIDDLNQYSGAISVVRDITKLIGMRKKYQKFLRAEAHKSRDILAICANCKSVRGENNQWQKVEAFFSHVVFSHGICPDCCEQLYPDINIDDLDEDDTL